MTKTRWKFSVLWVGTLLVCSSLAVGQEQREKGFKTPWGGSPITVKFPGGSLADYIKALKEASPGLNVILTVAEANEIRIPATQLDSVSAGSAISLIQGTHVLADGSSVNVFIEGFGGPPGEEASPVYKVFGKPRTAAGPPADVRVWSIGDLFTQTRKAEQILTAIETAVGLLKGYPEAQIRYHADTTLVVASGDPDQLRAIDRVVDGIRHGKREIGNDEDGVQNDKLSGLIQSLRENTTRPDANQSLHQTGQSDSTQLVQLLEALQKELREKDRIIRDLQTQLQGKKSD